MTSSHNHLDNNNPLADDLFNPLVPELGSENVDLGLGDREGSYIELINSESEELSLIEEMKLAQRQDDDNYEGSLFNNRPQSFSFNYNNYSGASYTGQDDDDYTVNQDATNRQVDDFGDEVIAQGTGLTGEYFDKSNLTKSILTRTDTNIDFDWKKGSPDSAIKKNTFSVRWTGQIEATQNETYTFYTQADDGVRLWVNNELIIDDWKQHGVQEHSGTIDLEAGEFYDIKLEYFEKKGSASVSLLWSSPSQNKEVIPTSFLYPEDYVPPTVPTDLAITAPGESTEQVTATLSLVSKGGDYNNEAGLFLVDDETGRIGNLNPGDDGYAAAALAPERRLLVLGSGENQNQTTIPGGSYVGSYLIQNNTTEAFLAHNPLNDLHSNPVAFFSFTDTNPDNFDHLETSSAGENSVNLAWEDLRGGGDKDFDDLIVNVDFAIASEPPVLPPTNLDFSIVAEGEVRVNGSSDFDGDPADYSDDALIYAGKGFTFNGNLELPVLRDEAGNAITDSDNKEVLLDNAVAVSSNYLYANANGNNRNRYSGLVPPQIVDTQTVSVPDYHDLLSENLFNAIPTDAPVIDFNIRHNRMNNLSQWQHKFPAPGTPDNPTVVKVKGGGLNIPTPIPSEDYRTKPQI